MRKTLKTASAIAAGSVLALTTVMSVPLPAKADTSVNYDVYVGGTQIGTYNKDNVAASTNNIRGKVTFDPYNPSSANSGGVLTLENAEFTGYIVAPYDEKFCSGIYIGENAGKVVIRLKGKNTVKADQWMPGTSSVEMPQYTDSAAIRAKNSEIVIEGESSSDSLTVGMHRGKSRKYIGVHVDGNLSVSSCSLIDYTPVTELDDSSGGWDRTVYSYGIYAREVLVSNAELDIKVPSPDWMSKESDAEFIGIKSQTNISLSNTNGAIRIMPPLVQGRSAALSSDRDSTVTISGSNRLVLAGGKPCTGALDLSSSNAELAAYDNFDGRNKQEYDASKLADYRVITIGEADPVVKDDVPSLSDKTIENGTYIITPYNNAKKALDIRDGSVANNANLQLWDKHGGDAQKFQVKYNEDTQTYEIKSDFCERALDISGGKAKNGTNVAQYKRNWNNAQKWYITEHPDGGYEILSAANPKFALDRKNGSSKNGTNIQMWTRNDSQGQRWSFVKTESIKTVGKIIPEGTYKLASKKNTNQVLDIKSGSTRNGANVRLWKDNGSSSQKFVLRFRDGYYMFLTPDHKRAIDVKGAINKNGTNVQQYTNNASDAQLWRAIQNNDGTYTFKNKATGKVLDVKRGSSKNGANVQIWTRNSTKAQKWVLKK